MYGAVSGLDGCYALDYPAAGELKYKRNPAPDGHSEEVAIVNNPFRPAQYRALMKTACTKDTYRPIGIARRQKCGVCPTYFQKICAFNFGTNATYIFDNHCVMDLYNCLEGTEFVPLKYDHCVYFGNFAYVHGYKYEDEDYGEDHIIVKKTKKNPDFIR